MHLNDSNCIPQKTWYLHRMTVRQDRVWCFWCGLNAGVCGIELEATDFVTAETHAQQKIFMQTD